MVIGSYRPAEARARRHPVQAVKEAIALHGACTELALGFLGLKDVASYLQRRFALEPAELGELSQFIHGRTDGNPLFVVALTDDLVRSDALRHDGGWRLAEPVSRIGLTIPDTVQILIGQQIENLAAEERRVLQIAAVSGAEFSAAAIAATPGLDVQAVEEICDRLVQRQQFITSRGSHDWPDGTVANRYAFVHAMYQEGLGSRVSEARRVEWQGRIAAREEQAYGANVRDIAAQLAVRFEAARQYDRSVKYFELAARNALSRQRLHRGGAAVRQGDRHAAAGPARRSRQGRAAHAAAAQRRRHRDAGLRDRRDREDPSTRADARPRPRRPAGRGARAAQHLDDVRGAGPAPQGAVARHRDLRPGRAHVRQDGAPAGARQARPDQLPSRRARHGARLFRECAGDLGRHAGRGTGTRRRLPGLDAVVSGLPRCRLPHGPRVAAVGPHAQGPLWPRVRLGLRRLGALLPRRARPRPKRWSTSSSRCPRSTACRSGSPGAPA